MKKLLATILALVMALSLLPTAWATGTTTDATRSAILLGTEGLKSGGVDKLRFGAPYCFGYGSYSDYNSWAVLDAEHTNSGADGMFLLCDYIIDTITISETNKTWGTEEIKNYASWQTAFYKNTWNASEKTAVIATTTTDTEYYKTGSFTFAPAPLNNEYVFFLSAKEVGNETYGFKSNNLLDNEATYWLRSDIYQVGSDVIENCVGVIKIDSATEKSTGIHYTEKDQVFCVRPAFNLDSSKVLLTTATESGKTASETLGTLTAVGTATGNEWKLTLLDSSRTFAVAETELATTVGSTKGVELNYSGAKTGENEYVSVLLLDSTGAVKYYGHIAKNSESGTATVTLPDGLAVGSYTLKVFSEQCNGGVATDYAGSPVDVKLTVNAKTDSKTTTESKTEVKGDTTVKTDTTVTEGNNGTTETVKTVTTTKDNKTTVVETKTVETATATTAVTTNSSDTTKAEVVVTVEENATPAAAETVTLDAMVADEAVAETVTKVEVKIPTTDAAKLESAKSVEVVTNVGTLTIDKNALKTLTEKEGNLVLTVSKTETSATETKFDLTAKVGTDDVFKNSAGKITITVPMAAPGFRQQIVCYYVDTAHGNTRTRMGGAGYKDGNFSWDTNHFSEFVVVTETVSTSRAYIDLNGGSSSGTTSTTATTVKKANSATTFDAGVGIYAATAILSVTGMAWVGKKKH